MKATNGQSLYDVALMTYSNFDHMIKLCVDNGINSINYQGVGVREITFDSNLTSDVSVLGKRAYVYATLNIGSARITENRQVRISENGSRRILEQ